jgi:hypothetical protein
MSRCEASCKNKSGKLLTNQTTVIVDITIRKDYIGPGGRTGPTKQPVETLNKTIGDVVMQCQKCKSRYHLFLKCPEGRRSEKVNYINMMMDMAEDFSERDPGELLAECIGDFLYDDLDHNVVQISKKMLIISHESTSSISIR